MRISIRNSLRVSFYSTRRVLAPSARTKIKTVLSAIFTLYISQFDTILKKDFKLKELDDLIKRRCDLVAKVNNEKFTPEELRVVSDCKILLDTINEFTSCYAAMHLDEMME